MTMNESIRKTNTHTHPVDTVNMEMVSVHCAQIAVARIVFSEMGEYNIREKALALWHKNRDMKIRSNIDDDDDDDKTETEKKSQQLSFVYTNA